ncbi:hypothetical protein NC651_037911 [Populus alba x Populus x berolinensis]|nr:hypothetical protein NC651_037911 [Populus alba x Populus x berolinensis]
MMVGYGTLGKQLAGGVRRRYQIFILLRPLIGSEHSAVHISSSQTPTLLHVLECQEPINDGRLWDYGKAARGWGEEKTSDLHPFEAKLNVNLYAVSSIQVVFYSESCAVSSSANLFEKQCFYIRYQAQQEPESKILRVQLHFP